MSGALVTDLYQLNMAASYLRRGMTGPATFSLFVRSLPESRGFLVAAGLEDCLRYLETFAFSDADLAWLRQQGLPRDSVDRLAALRFSGDVVAVPEGRVVFANEPLLEVTAPLPEAQLVETFLLNQMTYQTAVATKAARCRIAAGTIRLVDFSLRRTHGTEAGLAVARLSAIAGFSATSNVAAARRFGLVAAGTMAHSYIEAFPSEHAAFRAFAEDLPGRSTFLVDTYDTERGVQAAIDVIRSLSLDGELAVRLDSGDLVELARRTRAQLDEASLPHVQIFVSGGLDEYDLERFRVEGAPIDAAGVGTRLGVSADAPSLDSAYKLVAYDGRPVAKLSIGKTTLPGAKQVWRRLGPDSPIETGAELIAERDEPGPAGSEPLLVPVLRGGGRLRPPDTIDAARARLTADLTRLPARVRQVHHPTAVDATVSPRLRALTDHVVANLTGRAAEETPTSQ
jgi:nicotinate phosphoribosyltransferase